MNRTQSAFLGLSQAGLCGWRGAWSRMTALFFTILVFVSQAVVGWSQEDYSDELPRIEPTEAAETLANFNVADGFRI